MVWLCHPAYLVILIVLAIKLDLRPYDAKDSQSTKRKKKTHVWLMIAYIYVFPLLNAVLFTDKTDIILRTVFQFVTATYFNVSLLVAMKRKTHKGSEMFVPALVFLLFEIIRNFIMVDGFFRIILAQLQSIVITVVFLFVANAFVGSTDDELLHGDEIEKHKDDWAVKPRARQSEPRSYDRTPEPQSKKSWADSYAAKWEKATTSHYNPLAGAKSCSSCRYYKGGSCTNGASGSYNESIFDAAHHSCFLHNR
ncbi:MAG: hypothetical protein E7318_08420 [Clostridiales bacterium]|nr:hypothetical protein [Clostridiales bacterium]